MLCFRLRLRILGSQPAGERVNDLSEHYRILAERNLNDAHRYKAWLFDAWKSLRGQNKGLNRQARRVKALRAEIADARKVTNMLLLCPEVPNNPDLPAKLRALIDGFITARASALEEAAKICDSYGLKNYLTGFEYGSAIRAAISRKPPEPPPT